MLWTCSVHLIVSQVGVLLFADTLNTAFNIAWIYSVLINEFGVPLVQLPRISAESIPKATSTRSRAPTGAGDKVLLRVDYDQSHFSSLS